MWRQAHSAQLIWHEFRKRKGLVIKIHILISSVFSVRWCILQIHTQNILNRKYVMSNFKEYVVYRSLHQKFSTGNSLDSLQLAIDAGALTRTDEKGNQIAITTLEEAAPDIVKNLCAKVPAVLVDQLDDISEKLGISKRDFVEKALWEGLSVARQIYKDAGVDEFYSEFYGQPDPVETQNLEVVK